MSPDSVGRAMRAPTMKYTGTVLVYANAYSRTVPVYFSPARDAWATSLIETLLW